MPRPNQAALPIAYVVLRILIVVTWVTGAMVLALLVATVTSPEWTMHALGIGPDDQIRRLLRPLQVIAALGVLAVPLHVAVLQRLLAMVMTVRRGDPFVPLNARRLQAIGWLLVVLNLIGIVIGVIGRVISTPEYPIHLKAGFSAGGWVAVLIAFVLARVFAEGTDMRDELEGTV